MSRQTSNQKLIGDNSSNGSNPHNMGGNQLVQTLTTITANTTATNSSGDNVSNFSAGDGRSKKCVLIQAGLRGLE